MPSIENHKSNRSGWLRASVMGANDGIVSTASLVVGIAAANTSHEGIVLAGIAGLVAGAMSMAAGEYVSVSSQADTEKADLELEKKSLDESPEIETEELTQIYQKRGLEPKFAREVAVQLMKHDALGAHARDEIGISDTLTAKPIQAALSSALTFTIGAALPVLVAWLTPGDNLIMAVTIASLILLAFLGGLAAYAGGAGLLKGITRVTFWGALAMALTAGVGQLFGVVAG